MSGHMALTTSQSNYIPSTACSEGGLAAVETNSWEDGGVTNLAVLVGDPSLVTCKLCLDECHVNDMLRLDGCKCLFCEECMIQYVEVMVQEGQVTSITCPDGECKHSAQISDVQIARLCCHNTFIRYRRLKFEKEVDMDPYRCFCPAAGCEQVCHVDNTQDETRPLLVSCKKCHTSFCSVCKLGWHPEITCHSKREALDLEEMGISSNQDEDSSIKRCPRCQVLIEREQGCAQMMCKRCNHLFCWYCLHNLDGDFMLRHYDKGPCRNRLGHNRATVMWHRVQVIAVFAGFGLLFLVACPFMLLALPCILCCKLKCKCIPDLEELETQENEGM